jgi:putative two-component system response regulator
MSPGTGRTHHPTRILIVDDERNNRELLQIMLASEGHVLSTAASGEQALAMVTLEPFDLILLDIMMPGIDGYQVAATLSRNAATSHIPILMLTALDDRNSRLHGLSAGAVDFLTKPVVRAELLEKVSTLARQRKPAS